MSQTARETHPARRLTQAVGYIWEPVAAGLPYVERELAAARRSLERSPNDDTFSAVQYALYKLGRHKEALDVCTQWAVFSPKRSSPLVNGAAQLINLHDPGAAEVELLRAAELAGDASWCDPLVLTNLVWALSDGGHAEAAVGVLRQAEACVHQRALENGIDRAERATDAWMLSTAQAVCGGMLTSMVTFAHHFALRGLSPDLEPGLGVPTEAWLQSHYDLWVMTSPQRAAADFTAKLASASEQRRRSGGAAEMQAALQQAGWLRSV